jgi:hypothetical protein
VFSFGDWTRSAARSHSSRKDRRQWITESIGHSMVMVKAFEVLNIRFGSTGGSTQVRVPESSAEPGEVAARKILNL